MRPDAWLLVLARSHHPEEKEKIMNKSVIVLLTALLAAGAACANDNPATAKEAEAMVKKGVAFIKANGKEKGYAAITDRDNKEFHDRDLYLAVHRLDGTAVAHGTNEKMVGKNFIEMKDIDGK